MDPLPRRRKEGGGEIVEVYGFAGWIASLVAYALYLVWAYVPESTLQALGITYYPSKYWAIAVPSAVFVTWSVAVLVYIAVNFMSTAPLDSFDTITDMHAKPVVDRSSIWEGDGSPDSASRVPNIGDIDMSTVNRLLYQEPTRKGSSRGGIPRRRRDWASPTPRPSQRGGAGEQSGYSSRRQDGTGAEFVGSG
ncbi:unnamed protein product [Hapterophycus canaliculatus]